MESEFFRFDYFVTLNSLQKIGRFRGKKILFNKTTGVLRIGNVELERVPLGRITNGHYPFSDSGTFQAASIKGVRDFRLAAISSSLGFGGSFRMSKGYQWNGAQK